MKSELPPCRECGLCCCNPTDGGGIVSLDEGDIERLGRRARRRVEYFGHNNPVFPKSRPVPGVGYACPFLQGTPGKRVACRIYTRRPRVCREFKRGGEYCLDVVRFYRRRNPE